jgi:type IV pilus assembly protein PilP
MAGGRATVKMRRVALSLGVVAAIGCSEEAPTGSTMAEFSQDREAVAQRAAAAQSQGGAQKPSAAGHGTGNRSARSKSDEQVAGTMGGVDKDFVYDPTGKRDPFRSFLLDKALLDAQEVRGPLEQFDLAQLSLEAVIWQTGNARALISDPSGETYIIANGAKVGKNAGHVIAIEDSLVRVTETYVDHLGRETTKDIELRMRRNEGG